MPVKNETSSPPLSFLLVPHPVLDDEVALYDRLHLVKGQLQPVSNQLFFQLVVLFKVKLQQICRADYLSSLQGQLSALIAEKHFLKHCFACLADALHEAIGDLHLAGEDYVEVFDLVAGFVQLEGRISHEDAAHFEQADVDYAVVAQEERVECLQAEDRISQVLFIALLDHPWDLLYG